MMLCGMGKYGRVMTQYIGIVYDVIFLLLVLGAAETGRRRGFASGLVSLIRLRGGHYRRHLRHPRLGRRHL